MGLRRTAAAPPGHRDGPLSEGAIDAKAVVLLGLLAACFAALRVASPGINGFESEWFLLILAARVFGRGFGFVLGAVAFFASGLITGGIGPWLPFQMVAAGWVGFGAGCLPPLRGLPERLLLATYGVVAALVYGLLTNFWFWPFLGLDDDLLVRARTWHRREPAPVHLFRPDHVLGFRSHPSRDVRRPDSRSRPACPGGIAARFTARRLRATNRFFGGSGSARWTMMA